MLNPNHFFFRNYLRDMQSQVLGEKGRTSPEILGLFSRGGQKAVRWAAAKAGVSRKGARMLWVSLSCTHTSVANGMGRAHGTGNEGFV